MNKFKVGDKVKILKSGDHSYPVGSTVYIRGLYGDNHCYVGKSLKGGHSWNTINYKHLEHIIEKITINDLKKVFNSHMNAAKEVQRKIDTMIKYKLENWDDELFKIIELMNELGLKGGIEKAKKIYKLLKREM